MVSITYKLNGEEVSLEVRPEQTLLSALRDVLGVTSVKEGCGIGDCGACTVIADGRAVKSCTALAAQFDGKDIVTVDGLAKGDILHPLQQAFIDNNAVQCGFCIPGIIMAALSFLEVNPDPTREEIKEALSGNICRCTGYYPIIEAIENYVRDKKAS